MIELKPSGPWERTPLYLFWKPRYRRQMYWLHSSIYTHYVLNNVWLYSDNQEGLK